MSPGSKCLFCHGDLGENELAPVRVGRKIAFDPAKGRLWVVCWRCRGWNLFPLDQRWEALESCERSWRGARLRYSTGNIGLARLNDGSELIRVGKSQESEFAAWRYGDRFSRRRMVRHIRLGVGAGVAGAATVAAGAAVASGISLSALAYGGVFAWSWVNSLKNPTLTKLPLSSNWDAEVRRGDLRFVRLIPDQGDSWKVGTGLGELHRGTEALLTLALLLPHINRRGGGKGAEEDALRMLVDQGGPDTLISHLAQESYGYPISRLGTRERFALEMAVNEGAERELLENELRLLESAWKEAEHVAAIADSLLLPPFIEKRMAALKSRRGALSKGFDRERSSHGV